MMAIPSSYFHPSETKYKKRGRKGCERGAKRNFLYSFPLSGTPVVQSCRAWTVVASEAPVRLPEARSENPLLLRTLLRTLSLLKAPHYKTPSKNLFWEPSGTPLLRSSSSLWAVLEGPFSILAGCPKSAQLQVGRLPCFMVGFPTFMGRFPECLHGRSWKCLENSPVREAPLRVFLARALLRSMCRHKTP